MQNSSSFLIDFLIDFMLIYVDFYRILGGQEGGAGGGSKALFSLLGPRWAQEPPRAPQDPSKRLPRASKSPPRRPWGQMFGRFLIDFGCIFGQCFVDLLSFPGTVAGMAEGNWIRRPRRGAAV